jgi:Na+/phosphate symporter
MKKIKNHAETAEKKVQGALTVFSQAVAEVDKAQDILMDGIAQDSAKVMALKNQIKDIEAQIETVEADRTAKGEQMKKNKTLLNQLNKFNS